MAFVPATPIHAFTTRPQLKPNITNTREQSAKTGICSIRASQSKPKPPKGFSVPEPRYFFPRVDKLVDIATGISGSAVRGASGAVVSGYRLRRENGKLIEYSVNLDKFARPQQPLLLFDIEAYPLCRKVREAISILDIDMLVFPCPEKGSVYREYVKEQGGKLQFPYLIDPNTEFVSYDSDEIIRHLFEKYGDGKVPSLIESKFDVTAVIASKFRSGRGKTRPMKTVPAPLPIEVWGYEPCPFVKLVREVLCELEIPYYLRTMARGSAKRKLLYERTGRFQAPYIVDPNTDLAMFESADICDYLMGTYGPSGEGAVEKLDSSMVYMPGMPFDKEQKKAENVVTPEVVSPNP